MPRVTITKPDYDEIIHEAVATHRPRPHEDLDDVASLLGKLEAVGQRETATDDEGEIVETGRTVMATGEAALDLTEAEAAMLHARIRQALKREPATRAIALRGLCRELQAAEQAAAARTRENAIDDRIAEKRAELRDLTIEHRRLSQAVENLRAREARATEGAEA